MAMKHRTNWYIIGYKTNPALGKADDKAEVTWCCGTKREVVGLMKTTLDNFGVNYVEIFHG